MNIYAVKLTKSWVELREGDAPPTLKVSSYPRTITEVQKVPVKTRKMDDYGFPIYTMKEKEVKTTLNITQSRWVGGKPICQVEMREFANVYYNATFGYLKDAPNKLPASLIEKIKNPTWLKRNMKSVILVEE